jgi:hypothetical protein
MEEEKKPEPLTGQRRLENQYVKYEGKFLSIFLFLLFFVVVMSFVTFFVSRNIFAPARKGGVARDDLIVLARAANLYRNDQGAFPENMEELVAFSRTHGRALERRLFLTDPWNRAFRYFKVSDEQAAFVSSGPNRRLDFDMKTLSSPLEDGKDISVLHDGNIFIYKSGSDDKVILAGSWPSNE